MRDFRDAKTMARTLRDSLTTKAITISHGESLELVSRMLGVADWNTLSALLQAERSDSGNAVAARQGGTTSYPAIPIRDLVPFPTATFPLFVGREKTILAVNQAFDRQREVVLAVQRDGTIDEPRLQDIHEIGVLAQLLEVEPIDAGTLKVLAQARRRVVIRRFLGEAGAFRADVEDVSEGPIPDAPFLIKKAALRFEDYAVGRQIHKTWSPLDRIRDPGRVADIIAAHIVLPMSDRQNLLATIDPVARLERVAALLELSVPPPSPACETTRLRALDLAGQRRNLHTTLEHLLLALVDDADAVAVLQACNADLGAIRSDLLGYLVEGGPRDGVLPTGVPAKPSPAFERVLWGAALHARELAHATTTGANLLMAIFPETRSPAVRFLGRQGVSRERVADIFALGSGKTG